MDLVNRLDLEAVVREVLRRLEHAGIAGPTAPKPAEAKQNSQSMTSSSAKQDGASGGLSNQAPAEQQTPHLSGRVITLAQLPADYKRFKRLSVAVKAVLTPAVKDVLKAQGIELVRVDQARPAVEKRVTLAGTHANAELAGLSRLAASLRTAGWQVEQLAHSGLVATAGELATAVARSGNVGIFVTANPDAALCVLNRVRGVRALWGRDARQTLAASQQLGANLLVVAPENSWLDCVKTFVGGFPFGCTSELRYWQG